MTAPFRDWPLEKVINWASTQGFKGLEMWVSPTAGHIQVEGVLVGGAGEVKRALAGKAVAITSLAYYSLSILEKSEDARFLERCIEASSLLDVPVLCTCAGGPVAGKDKRRTLREDFPRVFNVLVDKAKEHGLKIALENWYATNLQGLGHFDLAFQMVPDKALGLNFDPSHLLWQEIDYVEAVHRFGERIYHTHAKDTEVLRFKLRQLGVLDTGWWRYRIPGRGDINWNAYLTALREVGYDSVLSIEHEDPFFKAEEGFLDGKRHLERLLL
ncbi:MAG: sugar phosphate isomerase/epimerase [Candidatus Bathyarchaeia archaeon]